jgi:uncharacterized protein YaeQ
VARTATVYHLGVELADVDRGVYESLDFRVAQHPSESINRLVVRILAYTLLYEEHLEFGRGLSDAEEPALWTHDLTGRLLHWVDVGTPSAERIHGASKKAEKVTVVCHKGEEALAREIAGRRIHDAENIDVVYLEPSFVTQLAGLLERNSSWVVVRTDGELSVTIGNDTFATRAELAALPL